MSLGDLEEDNFSCLADFMLIRQTGNFLHNNIGVLGSPTGNSGFLTTELNLVLKIVRTVGCILMRRLLKMRVVSMFLLFEVSSAQDFMLSSHSP